MPTFGHFIATARRRLMTSPGFLAATGVSLLVLTTWAWFATAVFVPIVAGLLAAGVGVALFATWLSFVEETVAASRTTNENLLTQLGASGRGNRRLAIYDSASGLYNRWYLELRLQEEYLRCKRYDLSMAVIVVRIGSLALADLSVDSWGGMASALAHTMGQAVRAVDITATLAPMEFAICLVHCDRAGAERAIARVSRELAVKRLEVGLACYPEDQCDGKALIELARGRAEMIEVAVDAA